MSDSQIFNLIEARSLMDDTSTGVAYEWEDDGWLHVHGTQDHPYAQVITSLETPIHIGTGRYTISVEVEAGGLGKYLYVSIWTVDDSRLGVVTPSTVSTVSLTLSQLTAPSGIRISLNAGAKGATVDYRVRFMLVEGTEPAAWAPAEGESLAGGGASMSANLLAGVKPTLANGTTESGGVWHNAGRTSTDGHQDWLVWDLAGQSALATNQTYHVGLSVKGASANSASLHATIGYRDAAGNANWATSDPLPIGTSWGRVEATIVVPSGMTPFAFYVAAYGTCPETWMASPTLSYGSPVTLASSAHTPYATQDHLRSEYATKAALKVTSDAVTAEVTERGKLAGRVGTLESTTGTHTSKLQQLAASITSLVRGESTYTDPDGKSATSGIYSLVEQTRDSVTALFGSYTKTADMQSQIATAKSQATSAANSATDSKLASYTKTADLASTAAVKDAKKAGTDAASAASAAQSTADTAKSTAQAAASDAATAKTNAASAVSTANSASTSAANAVKTANAASSTASSASSTANSAASTASAAQSTANTAKSAASAAQSTADTAKSNAATAQSTADAAKSAASKAQSTADAAKGTADGLATMIRQDADGVTVGKSADGETYTTGRTRMTADAFQVLDKAGATVTQLAADGASFLSGLVSIVAGKVTLPDNLKVNSITIDSGGGVAVLRGIVSSISANLNGVTSSVSAGWEQDFGHGVTAIVRENAHLEPGKMVPERMASTHLASDKAELYVGDNSVKVTGDSFSLSHPEYLRKGLRITQGSKVCHGHGTPWVTLFDTWADFQAATGCYGSGTPTLITMNGDYSAFDGTLSGCEIKGGDAVYVLAQTTGGLPNISSSQSLRINWICIW